jgi:hypothetical protein
LFRTEGAEEEVLPSNREAITLLHTDLCGEERESQAQRDGEGVPAPSRVCERERKRKGGGP